MSSQPTCVSNSGSQPSGRRAFVHVLATVPSKGNKEVLSKMKREADFEDGKSIVGYFESVLRPTLKEDCGELQTAFIVLKDGGDPIEVSELTDPVAEYIAMELKQMIFKVDAAGPAAPTAPARNLQSVLCREPMSSLPTWQHSQRPALNTIFATLRGQMEKDELGFAGSTGAKIGLDWMLTLTTLLYGISVWHDNFRSRGCKVPTRFAFSKYANDVRKKGKKVPQLTQASTEEALVTVQTLALAAFLDDDRWAAWKTDLEEFCVGLQKVHEDLQQQANINAARAKKQKLLTSGPPLMTDTGAPVSTWLRRRQLNRSTPTSMRGCASWHPTIPCHSPAMSPL